MGEEEELLTEQSYSWSDGAETRQTLSTSGEGEEESQDI